MDREPPDDYPVFDGMSKYDWFNVVGAICLVVLGLLIMAVFVAHVI